MVSHLRASAATCLVVAMLVGCTVDSSSPVSPRTAGASVVSQPAASASPSKRPNPTAAASVDVAVPPAAPAALDGKPSVAGAVQVAKFFLRQFPYAAATGDFQQWDRLSDAECKFCAGNRAAIARITNKGHHSIGGALSIMKERGRENVAGTSYTVFLSFSQAASKTVDDLGVVLEEFPGPSNFRAEMLLHWGSGKWSVRGVDAEEV
jgi:hypothetical protein